MFYDHSNVPQVIQMNDGQQIHFDPGDGHILRVVEDLTEQSFSGELDEESQVFVIQDDQDNETSEIAVWNQEKGEYEIISSEFNEFTNQILDILDNDRAGGLEPEDSAVRMNEKVCAGALESEQLGVKNDNDRASIPRTKAECLGGTPIKMERSQTSPDAGDDSHQWPPSIEAANEKNESDCCQRSNNDILDSTSLNHSNSAVDKSSKMIQLETATGRIIQLPGEDDHVVGTNGRESMNESVSEDEEQEASDLPFACNLCRKRFSRKLHLNNHMERHHGIKYVFTEKGRKVKLVRIPEGFKVVEGEKLDPCVEKLITTIDKDKLHSIIGVEEIEPDESEQHPAGTNGLSDEDVDESHRINDLLHGYAKGSFGCGFLFNKINYQAYRVAMDKGETPFAAFYPPDRSNVYLFRVLPAGEKQQLVLPATKKDVRNAMGAKRDGGNFIIPLVAALKISENTDKKKMILEPLPAVKPNKVEILSFEDFVMYARQCHSQESGIKSLADSIEVSPSPNKAPIIVDAAPKLRKKFQRRTTRNCIRESKISSDLCTGNALDTPISRAKKTMRNRTVAAETKLQKLRRNLKKEFDEEFEDDEDDDEEKDASYYPNEYNRPKKRGRGRPPGTKNRPKS